MVRRDLVLGCVLLAFSIDAAASHARCGDGLVDTGEQCDDGGFCIGGPLAGTPCLAESECLSGGACFGGLDDLTACQTDADCREGECIRCRPVGGDGCAANCTEETAVPFNLVPGRIGPTMIELEHGTSGAVIFGSFLTVPLPFTGGLTLLMGQAREGSTPVTIEADRVFLDRIPVGLPCVCVRIPPMATCGGTFLDESGNQTPHCTPDFPDAVVCPSERPCAAVNGLDNSASGFIRCGAAGVDVDTILNCDASPGEPGFPSMQTRSLSASRIAPNEASILLTTSLAVSTVVGTCTGTAPEYGPDGQFCTEDDAIPNRDLLLPIVLTTATATGTISNAGGPENDTLGPLTKEGMAFVCGPEGRVSFSRSPLVGVATSCDQPTVDDIVVELALAAQPTPTSEPCVGDCDADFEVTVDEVVTMVRIALGTENLDRCTRADDSGDGRITVDEILRATNRALDGCAQAASSMNTSG